MPILPIHRLLAALEEVAEITYKIGESYPTSFLQSISKSLYGVTLTLHSVGNQGSKTAVKELSLLGP